MAALLIWRRAFGGPKDGGSIPFPAGERYVPVSCRNREDKVALWYIGERMGDYIGELMGHYKSDERSGLAVWIELPKGYGGAFTRWTQADGDEDGN